MEVEKSNTREEGFLADLAVADAAAQESMQAGELQAGIDSLFKLEKKTRLVLEYTVTAKVAVALVKLCKAANDWGALGATIVLLSKRRQQHKKVITAFMDEAISYIDDAPKEEGYLQTLLNIAEGKIYLEVERARLTHRMAKLKEAAGDVAEAARIMQLVAVETFGTMDSHEKAEFILEQMRLCLAKKDFVRTVIVSEKIDKDLIEKDEFQDIKLRYYKQLIEYHTIQDNTLDLCRCSLRILHTPKIQSDLPSKQQYLQQACLFVALSAFGKDQRNLLHSIFADEAKELELIPEFKTLMKLLITHETIAWPLQVGVDDDVQLKSQSVFSANDKWWSRLQQRVDEHNIRVVAHWYTRIRLERFAELLNLDVLVVEKTISRMVCIREDGAEPLFAKIDRPGGIVTFAKPIPAEETLSDWASDLSSVMTLIEGTKFLIDKEMMAVA